MIHYAALSSNDLGRARPFYDAVLDALGLHPLNASDRELTYGVGALRVSIVGDGRPEKVDGSRLAFIGNRAMVDAFHRIAVAHGGTEERAPRFRSECDGDYYGASVRDPDGNTLEAVSYQAE